MNTASPLFLPKSVLRADSKTIADEVKQLAARHGVSPLEVFTENERLLLRTKWVSARFSAARREARFISWSSTIFLPLILWGGWLLDYFLHAVILTGYLAVVLILLYRANTDTVIVAYHSRLLQSVSALFAALWAIAFVFIGDLVDYEPIMIGFFVFIAVTGFANFAVLAIEKMLLQNEKEDRLRLQALSALRSSLVLIMVERSNSASRVAEIPSKRSLRKRLLGFLRQGTISSDRIDEKMKR